MPLNIVTDNEVKVRDIAHAKEFVWIIFQFVPITVDPRYLDFGFLEQPLISKRKSDPCFYIEI